MTLFTMKNRPGPMRIFDANGMELHRVVECDTETGRVMRFVHENNSYVLTPCRTRIVKSVRFYKPPLRVEATEQ